MSAHPVASTSFALLASVSPWLRQAWRGARESRWAEQSGVLRTVAAPHRPVWNKEREQEAEVSAHPRPCEESLELAAKTSLPTRARLEGRRKKASRMSSRAERGICFFSRRNSRCFSRMRDQHDRYLFHRAAELRLQFLLSATSVRRGNCLQPHPLPPVGGVVASAHAWQPPPPR